MTKRLTKVGNSRAVLLDKPIVDAMQIGGATPLDLTLVGRKLIISPADEGIGPDRTREHTAAIREQYGQTLKSLAK